MGSKDKTLRSLHNHITGCVPGNVPSVTNSRVVDAADIRRRPSSRGDGAVGAFFRKVEFD